MTATTSTTPSIRLAWRVVGSAIAVAALASLTWNVVDAAASRLETETRRVTAAGIDRVLVDVESADVAVVGRTDAEQISATARIRTGLFDPRFSLERTGTTLHLTAGCAPMSTSCVERLSLVLPAHVELQVTGDNGEVDVRGLDGRTLVETNNGDIAARDLGGPVVVRTDNGEVRGLELRADSVDAASSNGSIRLDLDAVPVRLVVDTDNGDVDVTLPAEADRTGVDFALTATSDNGSVTTPIRTNPTSRRTIGATSDNGDVTVAYRR